MKFEDLEFKSHPMGTGQQARVFFSNGYGASIVRFSLAGLGITAGSAGSYGNAAGLWELAVIKWDENSNELCYDTHITSDVMGHLSETEVSDILKLIENLENVT